MQKLVASLLLAIVGLSAGMLVSGSSYPEFVLPGGLPLGNVLAALGLCSLAGAALSLSPPSSICRQFSGAALLASALWLPLSAALAGNLALNFSGGRGTAWLAMSSATVISALGSLIWAVIGSLLGCRGKPGAA